MSVTTELAACPWNEQNRLLLVGLQTKKIDTRDLPLGNFRIASSVAQLGMLLRDSPHKGNAKSSASIPRIDAEDFAEVVAMARAGEPAGVTE